MKAISRRQTLLGAVAALTATSFARAQSIPDTARIIVGFTPGGAPDIVARRLAEQLAGRLARTVLVDNRPGAGGRIAVDGARQLAPDGLTLLLNPAGVHTINPHTYRKLNYDPVKDFAPLSLAASIDFGLAVGAAVPGSVKTIAEFAEWARARNVPVNYGSPAAGSPPHFVGDTLGRALGLPFTHVPYRGSTGLLQDLIGGRLEAGVLTLGDLLQQERAGQLRLLASTGPVRSRFAPQLATFEEQKVSGLTMRDWMAVVIVGNPTAEVVSRVGAQVRAATASEAYVKALGASLLEAASSSSEELQALILADLNRWGPIVERSGFVADL